MVITIDALQPIIDKAIEEITDIYKGVIIDNSEDDAPTILSVMPDNVEISFITKSDIIECFKEINKMLLQIHSREILPEDNIKSVAQNIRRTKYRWVSKEKKDQDSFYKEIDMAKKMFRFLNNDTEKFKDLTKSEDPLMYEKEILKELRSWASDPNSLLGEYRYIKYKKQWQILNALTSDAELLTCKNYIKMINDNPKTVWNIPKPLTQYPMDTTNSRISVDVGTLEKIKNSDSMYVDLDVYRFGDITFKSRYEVAMFKEHTLMNTIKRLGELDQKIIGYLLSIRDENFFRTREVITTIGDIAKNVSKIINGYTYMTIKESLFGLQYLTITAVTSELRGFSMKILDNVDIIQSDNKDVVRVLFNEDVVQQVLNNQTINMYKDVINNFDNPMSLPIILNLQNERIRAFNRGETTFKTNYNTFKRYLFLRDKKKKRNIERIVNALNEIVASQKTVKLYTRNGDEFVFEFYPITDEEKRDLFINISQKDSDPNLIELGDNFYQLSLEDAIIESLNN